MSETPYITIAELSEALGLSIGGIEKQIRNMKKLEEITREGGDKGGKWVFSNNTNGGNSRTHHFL